MKLSTPLAAVATAVVGATALSGIAFADLRTADAAAGPGEVAIDVRIRAADSNRLITLDDGHQVATWQYSDGQIWIHAPWVDVRKCLVDSAIGSASGRPVFVSRPDVNYADWIYLRAWPVGGTASAAAAVDVSISCSPSAVVSNARISPKATPPKPPRR